MTVVSEFLLKEMVVLGWLAVNGEKIQKNEKEMQSKTKIYYLSTTKLENFNIKKIL